MFNKELKKALGYKESLSKYGDVSVTLEKLDEIDKRIEKLESKTEEFIKNLYKHKFVYRLADKNNDCSPFPFWIWESKSNDYAFGKTISVKELSKLGEYDTVSFSTETYIISNKKLK